MPCWYRTVFQRQHRTRIRAIGPGNVAPAGCAKNRSEGRRSIRRVPPFDGNVPQLEPRTPEHLLRGRSRSDRGRRCRGGGLDRRFTTSSGWVARPTPRCCRRRCRLPSGSQSRRPEYPMQAPAGATAVPERSAGQAKSLARASCLTLTYRPARRRPQSSRACCSC